MRETHAFFAAGIAAAAIATTAADSGCTSAAATDIGKLRLDGMLDLSKVVNRLAVVDLAISGCAGQLSLIHI